MLDASKGKIFLAGERGLTEAGGFRSYHTISFGSYQVSHKEPVGSLYVLNDETLAGGKRSTFETEEDAYIVLLPLVGALTCKDNNNNEALIGAGAVQVYEATKDASFEIINPYEKELISYLQLRMRKPGFVNGTPQVFSFDFEKRNELKPLFSIPLSTKEYASRYAKGYIGKFDGRNEITYELTNAENQLFVFVVQGAFEVQYRLLETRDGLAVWNTSAVEVEALSNNAVLLLIEIPFD